MENKSSSQALVLNEVNRNVWHKGINLDNLLGKAGSPVLVESKVSQTNYTMLLGINEMTLETLLASSFGTIPKCNGKEIKSTLSYSRLTRSNFM